VPRLILLALLLAPSAALAHGGPHPIESGPLGWTLDPLLLIPLMLTLAFYAIGFARLKARRSLWRSALLFLTGWLVLTLALISPLHEAGERSFTLHMVEHELIMLVAALLLPLSRPLGVMLWALPRSLRRPLSMPGLWRRLADPVLATALQAVAMWAWHAPPLFNRALAHPGWHIAQHLSFLLTALIFWWAMLETPNRGVAALCLFVTSIVGGALGALMALASSPWYPAYAAMGMMPFGLTPTEDQQLAGLIMWVPGGLVHAGAAILLLGRYLRMAHPFTARPDPSGT
jgi:cytochrome c oxidase assembly factor CtaG